MPHSSDSVLPFTYAETDEQLEPDGQRSLQKRLRKAAGKPRRQRRRENDEADKRKKAKEEQKKKQKQRKRGHPLTGFYHTILSWPVLELNKDSRAALGNLATLTSPIILPACTS